MHSHAVGLYLVEHCTKTLQYGKCTTCEANTYNSEPNNQMTCEPCRSCSQANGTVVPQGDTHFCSHFLKKLHSSKMLINVVLNATLLLLLQSLCSFVSPSHVTLVPKTFFR